MSDTAHGRREQPKDGPQTKHDIHVKLCMIPATDTKGVFR